MARKLSPPHASPDTTEPPGGPYVETTQDAGRRSLCYDRKANKPDGNAMEMAAAIGVQLLTEGEYRHPQTLGEFDRKTSSWILTPPGIRALGGALFCDRRYDTAFTYHNGAEPYDAARGFRGLLRV